MPPALTSLGKSSVSSSVFFVFLWCALLDPVNAQPNADACSNRVSIRYIYAVMLSHGSYEYRAYLRNLTSSTLGWTMWLGSLPEGVSVLFEQPTRGVLAPYAGETLRIGRGPTAAINLNSVEVLYDHAGGARPFISLRSCVLRPR